MIPIQKLSKLLLAEAIRVITLALVIVVFGASATLAQAKENTQTKRSTTVTAADQQVSFTATARTHAMVFSVVILL